MYHKISMKRNQKGQGLVEYALLSGLVGLAVVGALMAFGPEIKVLALDLTDSVSGGYKVEDGELIPPGQTNSPTPVNESIPIASFTPVASSTPTASPTLTASPTPTASIATSTPIIAWSPTPTWTPIVIFSPTPNVLACTSGSATNITNKDACINLRNINNCENYSYNKRKDTCSWD